MNPSINKKTPFANKTTDAPYSSAKKDEIAIPAGGATPPNVPIMPNNRPWNTDSTFVRIKINKNCVENANKKPITKICGNAA